MDAAKVMQALQEPFPPEDIEWRVGSTTQDKKKGLALAYVTNRAIQNRLDEVFGPFGWQNQFKEWKQGSQLCGISVKFGDEWITKWDGADDSNQEATKGGLSDSMKRAAYQWGIGRYLYKLPQIWVEIEPVGRSFRIKNKPSLPAWAIPKGCQPDQTTPQHNEQPQQQGMSVPASIREKWVALIGNDNELLTQYTAWRNGGQTDQQIEQFLAGKINERNGSQGNGQTDKPATDNQRKAIFAAANRKSLDNDGVKRLVQYLTKKQSVTELTFKEASDAIKLLNDMPQDDIHAMISAPIDISDDDLPF